MVMSFRIGQQFLLRIWFGSSACFTNRNKLCLFVHLSFVSAEESRFHPVFCSLSRAVVDVHLQRSVARDDPKAGEMQCCSLFMIADQVLLNLALRKLFLGCVK